MSQAELITRSSLAKPPDYSGCTTAVGSSVTACPTSDREDDSSILEVYFTDPDGAVISEITYEEEVFLVVKTKNLEGDDVILDFLADGGDFTYENERIGVDNVLKLAVSAPEEKIPLVPIPVWTSSPSPMMAEPEQNKVGAAPDTSIKLLVTEAGGPQGQGLESDVHYDFWVKSFNRPFLLAEADKVKWMWKIEGGYNVKCYGDVFLKDVDGVFMPGIKLSFNPNFIGKKIFVMPYMNSPTEDVSVQVTIKPMQGTSSGERETSGAWPITDVWTEAHIKKYNDTLEQKGNAYKRAGRKFTCEDFALTTAMDFAAENGLPFKFTNGTATYDAASEKYDGNKEGFRNDVLRTSGAPDFQNDANAGRISALEAAPGSIILNKNAFWDPNRATHIQMIVKSKDGLLKILQGNFDPSASDRITSGDSLVNPQDPGYGGMPIEEAYYIPKDDVYWNKTKNRYMENFSKEKHIEFRRFNFLGMNG